MNNFEKSISIIVLGCLLILFSSLWISSKKSIQPSLQVPFQDIYLINLDRRIDRLNRFKEYYQHSDLKNYSYIRFSAIDGGMLNINSVPLTDLAKAELKQIESTGFRNKHYQLTKGAIGCYLSHTKVWESILKKGLDRVLVFEDDAKVPPNFLELVNESMKDIPDDWDIVLLGFLCNDCEDMKTYKKVNRFMLTHAYMIRKESILKIVDTNTLFPISQQIDAYMSELSTVLNIYTVHKKIVSQFMSRTDIQAPIYDRKAKGVNDRLKLFPKEK
jgi:GR25 family glycosyltransferase involved in LPS biosynthesis